MGTGKQERYRGCVVVAAPASIPPIRQKSFCTVAGRFAARASGRLELLRLSECGCTRGLAGHNCGVYGALSGVVVGVGHTRAVQRNLFMQEPVAQSQRLGEPFEDSPRELGSAAREHLDPIVVALHDKGQAILMASMLKSAVAAQAVRVEHSIPIGTPKECGVLKSPTGEDVPDSNLLTDNYPQPGQVSGSQGIGCLQGMAALNMPATTSAPARPDIETAEEGAHDDLFPILGFGVLQKGAAISGCF